MELEIFAKCVKYEMFIEPEKKLNEMFIKLEIFMKSAKCDLNKNNRKIVNF